LSVQHAFALSDHDLGAGLLGGERLVQRRARRSHVVGARDRPHPLHTNAAHRALDGVHVLRLGLTVRDDGVSCPPVAAE
jgi:hypothetical protein